METGMIHFIPNWNALFHILSQRINFTNLVIMRMIYFISVEQLNTIFFIPIGIILIPTLIHAIQMQQCTKMIVMYEEALAV